MGGAFLTLLTKNKIRFSCQPYLVEFEHNNGPSNSFDIIISPSKHFDSFGENFIWVEKKFSRGVVF